MAALSFNDAITESIRDASMRYHLNARDIYIRNTKVCWKSTCGGPIGELFFTVPVSKFEESIEAGVSDVSTLISFATLLQKPENIRFAENIRTALDFGAPVYFKVVENMYRVIAYVADIYRRSYVPLNIDYTYNAVTGEYTWAIPPSEDYLYDEGYTGVDDNSSTIGRPPASLYEAIGLNGTQTEGLQVYTVSESIRTYVDPDTATSSTEDGPTADPSTLV
jgi:hypothetical protein